MINALFPGLVELERIHEVAFAPLDDLAEVEAVAHRRALAEAALKLAATVHRFAELAKHAVDQAERQLGVSGLAGGTGGRVKTGCFTQDRQHFIGGKRPQPARRDPWHLVRCPCSTGRFRCSPIRG